MLRHIFTLIWNKKKQNFLLITEIFISFLVLFAVFSLLVNIYRNYRKPPGIAYENVWVVNFYTAVGKDSSLLLQNIARDNLKALPGVQAVSMVSSNVPFSNSTYQGSASYNNTLLKGVNYFQVDDSYQKTLGIKLTEGRWFTAEDDAARIPPVIINTTLKKAFFGNESAVGKEIQHNSAPCRICGVAEDVKYGGDFFDAGNGAYRRIGSNNKEQYSQLLVQVAPGSGYSLESRLFKTANDVLKEAGVNIQRLPEMRESANSTFLIPVIVICIISAFLVINVTLGLFGVLWYNISKRKGEIGLRRAIGATGNSIAAQLIVETLALATLSLLAGSIFAVQFPLLHVFDVPSVVYISALLLAAGFIYVLVSLCALYPGKQAAAIYPATALHEE